MGETIEDMDDVLGKRYRDVTKEYGKERVDEFLGEHELNTCDACGIVLSTYDLVWITAEDFEPRQGEAVPSWAYGKYDALCEACYLKIARGK